VYKMTLTDNKYYLDIIQFQQKEIKLLKSKITDQDWFIHRIIRSKDQLKKELNETIFISKYG
tara:strand:- start:687 stop:872 length:186 start_codon:yes stop_codon:yes gene_type:complete